MESMSVNQSFWKKNITSSSKEFLKTKYIEENRRPDSKNRTFYHILEHCDTRDFLETWPAVLSRALLFP